MTHTTSEQRIGLLPLAPDLGMERVYRQHGLRPVYINAWATCVRSRGAVSARRLVYVSLPA